jgi:hypothetical protein
MLQRPITVPSSYSIKTLLKENFSRFIPQYSISMSLHIVTTAAATIPNNLYYQRQKQKRLHQKVTLTKQTRKASFSCRSPFSLIKSTRFK